MVSFFPRFTIKGERPLFIGKGRPHSLVYFQCGIASHKGRNPKPQNLGLIVGFRLTNVNTFIIRVGFRLTNIDTIRILIRYQHDL